MKKNLIVILLLALCLCGCSQTYEDTNGLENYDLQTLTINDVFEGYSASYSTSEKSKLLNTGKTITYKNLNGITDVHEFEIFTFGDSDCTIKISYHIAKGNSALVIRDTEHILYEITPNKDDQEFFVEVDDWCYLTVYGESCECTIDYEIYY